MEVIAHGQTNAFFSRVFGFSAFNVSARAVARVGSPAGLRNFIPFAVMESEIDGLATGDPATLKLDTKDKSKGNSQLLDIPAHPDCPWGSNNFRKTVYCGSSQPFCAAGQEYPGCSSTIPTFTGDNVGPLQQSLQKRLQDTSPECDEFPEVFLPSPDGASDVVPNDRCNPFAPHVATDSKRVVILPVIDVLPSGTSAPVVIMRFALFFVTELTCSQGNQCELKGIYVQNVGNFGGYEAVGAYSPTAPFIIRRLIE